MTRSTLVKQEMVLWFLSLEIHIVMCVFLCSINQYLYKIKIHTWLRGSFQSLEITSFALLPLEARYKFYY